MKNVKQLLETDEQDSESQKLAALVECGLLDENKAHLVHRAMTRDTITVAEKNSLLELTDNLISETLLEKSDYLSKFDDRKEKSAKDIPAVIILKRKAIRVYPDNQKVGLYYSQQLDRYVSIPYGGGTRALGMELSEARKSNKDLNLTPIKQSTVADLPLDWRDVGKAMVVRDKSLSAKHQIGMRLSQRQLLSRSDGEHVLNDIINQVDRPAIRVGLRIGKFINKRLVKQPPQTPTVRVPRGPGGKFKSTKQQATTTETPPVEKPKTKAIKPAADAGAPGSPIRESFDEKLNRIRRQRQMNEGLPLIGGAIAAVGKVAGSVANIGIRRTIQRGLARRKAAQAKTKAAGVPDPKSLPKRSTEKPEEIFKKTNSQYNFSQEGRNQGALSAPERVPIDIARSRANQMSFGTNPYVRQQQMRESNLDNIRAIAESENTVENIQIGESVIPMTTKVAKKIVKVYESLNKKNKTKMEKMLNEDAISFKKAVNFAVRN